MQAKDGTTKEHAWVFRENAIENVFNGLSIAGGQSKSKDCDEDTIVEAMQSSGLRLNDAHESERSKVGQIIVEIRRVVLGRKFYDQHYRSKHREGKDEDIKMNEVKGDVTHATGLTYKSTIAPLPLRVVDYWDYKPEEGLWATFQFFYRSAGTFPLDKHKCYTTIKRMIIPQVSRDMADSGYRATAKVWFPRLATQV